MIERTQEKPVYLTDRTRLFPVYHCGYYGVKLNRKKSRDSQDELEMHRKDWQAIREYMDELKARGDWK
jgi:hypothetical protein